MGTNNTKMCRENNLIIKGSTHKKKKVYVFRSVSAQWDIQCHFLCLNNECFDFWESKEPFICMIWIMFSFSTCLGYRWIPKKRPVSLFCWKLLRLLFILLWCCQQRWTALCKAIYLFHHIQLIINILITLVLKYKMCTVWVCSSVNIN